MMHTPGRWASSRTIYNPTVEDIHGRVVAACTSGRGQFKIEGDEALANARLIAAAPDMLAALKECPLPSTMGNREDHYQRFYDWYRRYVQPAVAKAEGRQ